LDQNSPAVLIDSKPAQYFDSRHFRKDVVEVGLLLSLNWMVSLSMSDASYSARRVLHAWGIAR